MPRAQTHEIYYTPVAAAKFEPTVAAAFPELNGITYDIEQPWEPLLFRLVIPNLEIETLNAVATIAFEDETGVAQIFQESAFGGKLPAASQLGVVVERRIVPEKDFTITPTASGPRKLKVTLAGSAGKVIIPANTAKKVAFFQILNLARQ
jgi:hypothetical protein